MPRRSLKWSLGVLLLLSIAATAWAQAPGFGAAKENDGFQGQEGFGDPSKPEDKDRLGGNDAAAGIQLGKEATTQRLKIGVEITAVGGPCQGLVATVPVPLAWPEQEVEIIDEETTTTVGSLNYRDIGGTARQMVVKIPRLAAGQDAKALVTFEIKRRPIEAPRDTAVYQVPDKVDRDLRIYLAPSPFIESTHSQIKALAREATEGKQGGWSAAEALYDITRQKVEYKNGPLKGALRALRDGTGDCEEMTSLFIALCRASKIPARCVWVDGHCYPEFYLQDSQGQGHWFPCQAAGTRAFGSMPESRAILQKGDNFRDPDRPRERLRYVNEHVKGLAVRGGGKPQVKFVRMPVN